ncbi:MAG: hypothetical protein AB7P21_01750 [Lautropia sp.]
MNPRRPANGARAADTRTDGAGGLHRSKRAARPVRAWWPVAAVAAALATPLLAGGCATVPLDAATSRTVADEPLQADIRRALAAYEAASGVDPGAGVIVRAVDALAASGDAKVERWTIDRHGTLVAYRVTMTPVPTGGTRLRVEPER